MHHTNSPKASFNRNIPDSNTSGRSITYIIVFLLLSLPFSLSGCYSYSFTGTSIPEGVNSIYIPFFADQSTSGIGDLSDQLNQALIDRFVNQTKLNLANSRADADAVLEGQITNYTNRPFSVTSDEETDRNQVTITVRATYLYTDAEEPEWNQQFSGSATYDPNEDPIEGEENAATQALEQVVNNMFNDAVSDW
ncbi:LPS assembly lipoprotein LptE [Aliifodinibius sp. S!AR15-10]|nr:LPS assembly lipoprotein LptE [Aliifodinibius sp. S!AR15-10]